MNNDYVNDPRMADIYPGQGVSTAVAASAPFNYGSGGSNVTAFPGTSAPSKQVENAVAIGAAGNPLLWWGAIVVLLLAIMYAAEKFDDRNFSSVELSAYNIFIITVASIVGTTLFKLAATKYPVPGLSAVILAA